MHKAGRLDVVWATDENYVFLTGVSMVSLFENNKFFEQIAEIGRASCRERV